MILALDTSLGACSVAVVETGSARLLAGRYEERPKGHGEVIMGMIKSALGEAGLKPSDLKAVVCTTGPGSFTGLRIGIAAARGLALGLDIPALGISTLETLAASVVMEADEALSDPETIVAVIGQPRGCFAVQTFESESDEPGPQLMALGDITLIAPPNTIFLLNSQHTVFVGPEAGQLANALGLEPERIIPDQPSALVAGRYLAAYWPAIRETRKPISPIYLRPAVMTSP